MMISPLRHAGCKIKSEVIFSIVLADRFLHLQGVSNEAARSLRGGGHVFVSRWCDFCLPHNYAGSFFMGVPYLLIAFSPSARSWLPKPGVWMLRLKEILAFPVYGTRSALLRRWLVWCSLHSPRGFTMPLA
jgi:hypothetical protein